jgi:hypothetical protein
MVSTVKLGRSLRPVEEYWLVKTVGPRLHYLPKSIGGEGWLAKCEVEEKIGVGGINGGRILVWYLSFEDDKLASYFALKFL